MTEATLLYYGKGEPSNLRLTQLSEFLGVKWNLVKIAHQKSCLEPLIDYIQKENLCVMASASAVGSFLKAHPNFEGKESLKEKTGIYVRHYLSEFRDNFLCKHKLLLSMAERLKKGFN